MDLFGIIFTVVSLLIIIVIAVAYFRNANINYRIGKGMFENSDNNLDEAKELSDKEYYDGNKGLFK
ncbi:MAG: hypothetical protein ACI4HO_07950 [Ruminococcus sp.]